MKRLTDRRTILLAAGAAAVVAAAGAVSAQSAGVSGTVAFEGGAVIPAGEVEIYIEDPAAHDDAVRTRVESGGKSRTMDFSLPPTSSTASSGTRIVARLERADGWLLARGSAQLGIDSPVHITLHTAMH